MEFLKAKIPYFGDQMTHVKMQGGKTLRALAPEDINQFKAIGPFVITLWHMKQDLLEVCL